MTFVKQLEELGRRDVPLAGGKGANLGELCRAGLPVPPGFVLTTAAYAAFVEANGLQGTGSTGVQARFEAGRMPPAVSAALHTAYAALGRDVPVAVRSSATAEDLAEASFAGQQETYLNVRGQRALMDAVIGCWASLWTPRAIAYRAGRDIDRSTLSLAVVVQEMVEAHAAGVLFTANPVNGRRTELVIAAAWGLGEAVVSGAVSTDDLVMDKDTAKVLSRTTADKQVRTVYAERGVQRVQVPKELRREPVLDDEAAARLTRLGVRIETLFGVPQDIEWALADRLFVVQARPITALPEPAADPPTDWTVPRRKDLYFRASIVEQLPDPLSPLFADLIDGSVARSLHALVRDLRGRDVLRPDDVGLPTVNGYAYYRYTRGGMVRFTLTTPQAFRFMLDVAERRWRQYAHPRYESAVARWARPATELPAGELLSGAQQLLDAATEYYTSVQTIIPLAAGGEALFTAFYERLVRRAGDPAAQTFLLGFDSLPIRAEQSLYDLAAWARQQPALPATLGAGTPEQALADAAPAGVDPAVWQRWRSRLRTHLGRFGHTLYNLDFIYPVPADDPGPLLDTLRFYLRGQGTDPRLRQRRSTERRLEATDAVAERLDRARRAVFRRLLGAAQRTAPLREDALADVGLAWPTLRRMLLELGRRLVAADALDQPTDVFWLRQSELECACAALDRRSAVTGQRAAVEERKFRWRGQRLATPPQLLPHGAWTRLFDRMMPAVADDQAGDVLRGVAGGAGAVTAPARVLTGPADFGQMRPGEVLVAGITTPAWTPLFAMASAVVTDVGGPLSHSSIVAREYGIPAVLGTGVATRRIRSGNRLRVDGDAGTVQLLPDEEEHRDPLRSSPARADDQEPA
jgi:pyruvate,water dikinase